MTRACGTILAGTVSAPFAAGEHRQIAVKVIDDRGGLGGGDDGRCRASSHEEAPEQRRA